MTFQEINFQISNLRMDLKATDSRILEYVEGVLTDKEFEAVKKERANIRSEIEKLTKQLPKAKKAWEAEQEELLKEQEEE